jgi:ribonuclease E
MQPAAGGVVAATAEPAFTPALAPAFVPASVATFAPTFVPAFVPAPVPVAVAAEAPAVAAVAAMPAPVMPVAVAAPVVAAVAPVAAPAVAAVAAVTASPAFELPLDSLQAVAESAGLQWVNSDTSKIRAVQAAMAAEPAPAHVPRERAPVAQVEEGALVLVETRKDLSQFKLPFETAGGAQPQG